MPEIIILACVALFIGLRLYAVLGRRTGHEQQPIAKPAEEPRRAPVVARTARDTAPERRGDTLGGDVPQVEPSAVEGVRAIVAADASFDVGGFLEGARSAYAQALGAFWSGDGTTLERLAAPDVLGAFKEAIAARDAAGETLDNRLVSIERATIDGAGVADRKAIITVRFDADIASVTRDAEGNVVAGSLTDAIQTHDLWTFSRALKSSDPNWLLIETDEAA